MNQIDQIKEILFSNEKRALDALTRRIEGRESRVADIADVLPEALGRSHANGEKINKALQRPVEEILKDSVQKDPQGFADLLFPVMGPAIRKSITETLREFTESINRAVEEQLSVKSLKWRRDARKAGVPYGQYLMQRNLKYRVDHAYLIQPNSGLLIADAHRPEAIRRDDEAVSAMLTAIQDFVKESFTTDNQSGLETADIGEYSLWVMQGPEAMLACVIFGIPPRSLREDFIEVLESIHLQYGQQLEHFDGQQLSIIDPVLEECLLSQAKEVEEKPSKSKIGFTSILGLILLAALVWFGWQRFQFNQQAHKLIESFESQAGIVLTETDVSGGKLRIEGLRDPLAAIPNDILSVSDISKDKVSLKFTPFHSLEPEVLEKRVRAKLAIPAGVNIGFNETGEVAFDGKVTMQFKQEATSALETMLGVNQIKFGDIFYSDSALLAEIVKQTNPPESVDVNVKNQILAVSGIAPIAFHKRIANIETEIDGLEGLSLSGLRVLEIDQAKNLLQELDGQVFRFSWRTKLEQASEESLEGYANKLKQFGSLLVSLDQTAEVVLTGFTDDSGSSSMNQDLQLERSLYIKGRLVGLGIKPDWLFVKAGQNQDQVSHNRLANTEMRKVLVSINNQL